MPDRAAPGSAVDQPQDIFTLSSRLVDVLAGLKPLAATAWGVPGHDHAWDDFSPGGAQALVGTFEEFRGLARALPAPTDHWGRVARLIFDEFLELELDRYEQGDHLRDLNNIASTFQSIREVFDDMPKETRAGWENIVARLTTIGSAARSYVAALDEGRRRGLKVARRQVLAVAGQAEVHAGRTTIPSFFRGLLRRLEEAAGGSPELAAPDLRRGLEEGVETACRVFGELADYLRGVYLPDAVEADAVGRDRYVRNARRFLGMEPDPLETYMWGWQQIREIQDEMARLASQIEPGTSPAEVIRRLKSDPDLVAATPEQFVGLMQERQERALSRLQGSHFDIPEEIRRIEVKLAPPGGALAAYYKQPSEDFTRPGTVWYPYARRRNIPLYEEVSTTYHEGFPGHHLQCGTQVALSGRLSRLHRLAVWYPGYGEGWALYAEQLMKELGYLDRPEFVLGMLVCQMLRACRVVIDIGCHLGFRIPQDAGFHPGEAWSYELGREMLLDRAFSDPDMADSEMTRYLGWPAQAISYKVGQRVILELREELRRREGPAFDLRDFHARVVGSGPVGLDTMRELVLASA